MLDVVRKYSSSKWAKAIFLAIAASFFIGFSLLGAVWRSCSMRGLKGNIAKVGKWFVTPRDLITAYNRLNMLYSSNPEGFPENVTQETLKEIALGYLTNTWLLAQTAKKLKWRISEEELNLGIRSALGLRDNIPKNEYLRLLGRNRLFPEEFEKQIKLSLLAQKITDTLKDTIIVDDETLWEEYKLENQKISLYFVKFDVNKIKRRIRISRREMRKFYEEHKEEFTAPEKRLIRYTVVSREEAKKLYQEMKNNGFDETCVRENLECSETPPLEKNGSPPSQLKEFKGLMKRVFKLEEGAVGKPLYSGDKALLFKVHGILKSEVLPFNEVRDKIKERLLEIKAKEIAEKRAERLIKRISKSRKPHLLARRYGYKVEDTGWIAFGDSNIKGIGERSEVAISAWFLSADKRVLEKPVFYNNAYYVVMLKEKKVPSKEEFEKKVEEIRRNYIQEHITGIQNQLILNLYSKYPVRIDRRTLNAINLSY